MTRPEQSSYWFVIPRSGIDVPNQQPYWHTRRFALKDSRQNLYRVWFSSLASVTRLPGTPSIKIPLNFRLVECQSCRTPIDNASERRTLTLPESRYSKQLSKCVAGHVVTIRCAAKLRQSAPDISPYGPCKKSHTLLHFQKKLLERPLHSHISWPAMVWY